MSEAVEIIAKLRDMDLSDCPTIVIDSVTCMSSREPPPLPVKEEYMIAPYPAPRKEKQKHPKIVRSLGMKGKRR